MKLYTIYDSLAQSSGPLFEAMNHEVAKRKVVNLIKTNNISQVEDFLLICVGEFDNESHTLIDTEWVEVNYYPEYLKAMQTIEAI